MIATARDRGGGVTRWNFPPTAQPRSAADRASPGVLPLDFDGHILRIAVSNRGPNVVDNLALPRREESYLRCSAAQIFSMIERFYGRKFPTWKRCWPAWR